MLKKILIILPLLIVVILIGRLAIVSFKQNAEFKYNENLPKTIKLYSDDFQDNGFIPLECSGIGKDLSPSLRWDNLPQGVKSLAIIAVDYDAPAPYFKLMTIDHWLLFNIPPYIAQLNKGSLSESLKKDNISFGENITGGIEYVGPNPPLGSHSYFFRIYALSISNINLLRPNKSELMNAMKGNILAYGELIGKFKK